MFNSTRTFIKNAPHFATTAEAITAACVVEIACWLKGCGFDVRRAAEAIEGIAPQIEAAAGSAEALIVLATDGRGLAATVSADDAELERAVEKAHRLGLALLGVNPAIIAQTVREAYDAPAHSVH